MVRLQQSTSNIYRNLAKIVLNIKFHISVPLTFTTFLLVLQQVLFTLFQFVKGSISHVRHVKYVHKICSN